MKDFDMSMYKNKEDMYKDKAEYYEGLFNTLLEHAMYEKLVITDDDGNLVNTNDGNYIYED